MENKEVAKLIREIGSFLEIEGKEPRFKVQAYNRAAQSIETYSEHIENIAKENRLEEIPGVGSHIAAKIEEILETGTCKKLKELRKRIPIDLNGLMSIEGIGPRKIKILYDKLKIKNIEDLKKAAEEHKIQKIKGFAEKSENEILDNIEYSFSTRRFFLEEAEKIAFPIRDALKKIKGVEKIELAGSLRRRKITVGDIDILCVAKDAEKVMEKFVKLSQVEKVLSKGPTRSSVRLKNHIECDIRVVPKRSWGAALSYFTGSKEHNVKLRIIAKKYGWKLNEYGLFDKDENFIAGRTEKELYRKLGLKYVPPEERETAETIKELKK